jgi:hypothetical protein
MHSHSNDLTIGKLDYSSSNTNYSEGKTIDVAIWNAELSAADISDIYNSGEPTDLTLAASYNTDRTSNLKGYWRMGNGTLDGNDGSDDSTWLIADQTDATLGSELIIANPYVAASWSTYGTNVESFVSGESVTITYGNSSSGSLATFNNSTNNILESNIVAGKKYKFSFTLATDDTDVNPILLGADEGNIYAGTGAGDKVIYFTGKSSGSPTFRVISLSAGKYYTLSNLSLKQVGGNPGTSVNMATDDVAELAPNRLTGTMTNMASGDIETDVPS